ncbi:MAG: MarR family winged helix-turn-helix transcriptional regulator [Fastidiosipilaceae bacterium]|jgi:DNA-binding MarR family transcriptional regulator|nr:MarR family transcriptional regulator [Clostridiaceae bacterium]
MKPYKSFIRSILKIQRTCQLYIYPRIAKFGVGRGQWYFLNRLLFENDGLNQETLSEEMVVDKAHTTRAIRNLEENGFVCCQKDEIDGRKKKVFVTEKSREIESDYHQIFKDLNAILVKDFSGEEKEALRNYLHRMMNNIQEFIDESERTSGH